jgi:SAM-dependent methyltransferase
MCGAGATLLEIGCGTGEFAEAAMAAGFQVTAVEPGSLYDTASRRVGTAVHCASWEEFLPGVAGRFDAVVAWEVVEHLLDPGDFVSAAASAVKPGGVFALSTPNARSWSIRILGAADPMLCPDEHLKLFSNEGLRRLLGRAARGRATVHGFGHLLPEEAASGLARLLGGRQPPRVVARAGSGFTKALRHPRFSLGLEAYLRTPSSAG